VIATLCEAVRVSFAFSALAVGSATRFRRGTWKARHV
jgi:hypothetical protein